MAPLIFSNPRNTVARTERRTMRQAEYVRSAPSNYKYIGITPSHHAIRNVFKANLHLVSGLAYNIGYHNVVTSIDSSVTSVTPRITLSQTLPFPIPSIMVAFKETPSESRRSKVESLGGQITGMGNQSELKYMIPRGSLEVLQEYAAADFIKLNITAPKDFIAAGNIPLYMTLRKRLTSITQAVYFLNALGSTNLLYSSGTLPATASTYTTDLDREGITIMGNLTTNTAPTGMSTSKQYITNAALSISDTFTLTVRSPPSSSIHTRPWRTTTATHPSAMGTGNFAQYVRDYTGVDKNIIWMFTDIFSTCFTDTAEILDICRFWTDELAETECGLQMAHLMAALMMAYKLDRCPSPLFLSTPPSYCGTVLYGHTTFTTPLGEVRAFTPEEVLSDLRTIKTHEGVLQNILTAMGSTATVASITSMRSLRRACGVFYDSLPSTTIKDQVTPLLPYLNFGQYLNVNASTIIQVVTLLADPNLPIPDTLPLHPAYFFTTDRFQDVLSAFGASCPDLWSGQEGDLEMRVSATVSSRGRAIAPEEYKAVPPQVLQTLRVDVVAAAAHWRHIMTHGTTKMITSRLAGGGRSYNGVEKSDLWRALNNHVGESVARHTANNTTTINTLTPVVPQVGQRRPREDEDSDENARIVRQRTNLDF